MYWQFLRLLRSDILTEKLFVIPENNIRSELLKNSPFLDSHHSIMSKLSCLMIFPAENGKIFIWHNILVERWEKGSFSSSLTWLLSFKRVFPFCALRHFRLFFILNDLNQWRQSGEKEAEKKSFSAEFFAFSSKPLIALISLTNSELFVNQDWFDWKCSF